MSNTRKRPSHSHKKKDSAKPINVEDGFHVQSGPIVTTEDKFYFMESVVEPYINDVFSYILLSALNVGKLKWYLYITLLVFLIYPTVTVSLYPVYADSLFCPDRISFYLGRSQSSYTTQFQSTRSDVAIHRPGRTRTRARAKINTRRLCASPQRAKAGQESSVRQWG